MASTFNINSCGDLVNVFPHGYVKSAQCQRSGLPAIRPSVRPGAACALAGGSRRTRAPPPRRIARAPRGGSGRASRARQTARRRSHRLRARSCRRRPLASHLAPRPAAGRREARTRSASGEGGRGLRRRTCTLSRRGCQHSTGQRCSAGWLSRHRTIGASRIEGSISCRCEARPGR